MTRQRLFALFAGAVIIAFVVWVARHTYWAEVRVPMPLKGEAATNPFYAAQRFSEALGARTSWDRVFTAPPRDAVLVLSAWHWNLSAAREQALERWVEAGGRLVADKSLLGGRGAFDRWSGIHRVFHPRKNPSASLPSTRPNRGDDDDDGCREVSEERDGHPIVDPTETKRRICDVDDAFSLAGRVPVVWGLRDGADLQVVRVRVGRGSVTWINAAPYRYRSLLDGDHGWLFVAATELKTGDEIHFLSEDDHPSLVALLWRVAAPLVLLLLTAVALALWRCGVRFGPLAAAPDPARRSLAEQIRGTGRFVLRHGGAEPLHAATVRALDEAARRRVPQYGALTAKDRLAALAGLTGLDSAAIGAAIFHPRLRRAHELRNTIAFIESARRRILERAARSQTDTRTRYGTD